MTAKGKKFHMLWSNRNLYKKSKPRVKLVASANTLTLPTIQNFRS
jgi:hypothetical protein